MHRNPEMYTYRVTSTSNSQTALCLRLRLGKPAGPSGKQNYNWFPEGPDIKCFVIFLDFHFNSNKRITGANQNSPLGKYL